MASPKNENHLSFSGQVVWQKIGLHVLCGRSYIFTSNSRSDGNFFGILRFLPLKKVILNKNSVDKL